MMNPRRTIPPLRHLILILALSGLGGQLLGCTEEPEPTRRIQMNQGKLDMVISTRWELADSSDDLRVYTHPDFPGLQLHFENSTEVFGSPLRVTQVKSLIGQELNREYGGTSSRVTMGGNALMRYRRLVSDPDGEEILSQEWVVAKPVGHGDIARVAVSLHVPRSIETDPSLPQLIETLDRRLGDARIPRV